MSKYKRVREHLINSGGRLFWRIDGPKNTQVQNIECWGVHGTTVIVSNMGIHGVEVYTPTGASFAQTFYAIDELDPANEYDQDYIGPDYNTELLDRGGL